MTEATKTIDLLAIADDLEELERRLTDGKFYHDYDEDLRLLGVYCQHVAALRAMEASNGQS